MPGTPTRVISCGELSCSTRASVENRRESSRSRPTSGGARAPRDVGSEPGAGLNRLPDLHRLRLAFGVDRRRLAVLDHAGGRVVGRLLDEDPVHRRGVLQPGGGVDDVSRDQPTLGAGARLERDEDLARVDGDPDLELLFLADPVADREGRPNRALGIVLVRDRGAEDRHHGVADELLDGAAADLQLGPEPVVERPQNRLDVLGVERVRRAR